MTPTVQTIPEERTVGVTLTEGPNANTSSVTLTEGPNAHVLLLEQFMANVEAPSVWCKLCHAENMRGETLCHLCARPLDQKDKQSLKIADDVSEASQKLYQIVWRRVLRGKVSWKEIESKRARKQRKRALELGFKSVEDRWHKDKWFRDTMEEEGCDLDAMRDFDELGNPENRNPHVPVPKDERIRRGYGHWVGSWANTDPSWRRPREFYDWQWATWTSWDWD